MTETDMFIEQIKSVIMALPPVQRSTVAVAMSDRSKPFSGWLGEVIGDVAHELISQPGMTAERVAEMLGVSRATVNGRLSRKRKRDAGLKPHEPWVTRKAPEVDPGGYERE